MRSAINIQSFGKSWWDSAKETASTLTEHASDLVGGAAGAAASQAGAGLTQGITGELEAAGTRIASAAAREHAKGLTDVGFSEDERRLVTASHDGTVGVWDVDESAPIVVLRGGRGSVTSASFLGNRMVLSASGREARLWDARPDSELRLPRTLPALLALANRRLAATARKLTRAERKRYLG